VAIKTKKQAEDIINSVINNDDNNKTIDNNQPEIFEARVTRLAPNPRFVYGSLEGIQIEVFMPRFREKSVGRKIQVVRAEEMGENRYKLLQ